MKHRLQRIGQRFKAELALYRRILADPRTPRRARWLLGAAVAYALSPVDLIPDFIPVIGHLDDALILPLLVWLALRCLPPSLLAEHRHGGAATGNPGNSQSQATGRESDDERR